ncbi:MAG TPA: diguanylate cyclase [Steroidobacteraceae bacterium]|nr:diguanylate cyclase [Steroidobacteraceae bacterium]
MATVAARPTPRARFSQVPPDMEFPVSVQPASRDRDPFESLAAIQLRRGYPWLKFFEPLEGEFRREFRVESAAQIRRSLWVGLALVLAFAAMGQLVPSRAWTGAAALIGFGAILPLVLLGLALAYSRHYESWFAPVMQVLAPLAGVGIVALELIAVRRGSDLGTIDALASGIAPLVLTTIYLYILIGLPFYAALRSALIVLVTYVAGALVVYPAVEPALYDSLVLVFANVIGATVCYTLEKTNRTNFLEARLLGEMASRDGLTGIYNRRMLDEHLDTVWQQATRDHVPLAVLLVDIDHFKAYNDYFGHQAGDECLRRVAHTLARSARRPLDFTARYGGEEFAIVLYNARRDYVEDLAATIRANVAALAMKHPGSPVSPLLTVSIGAACIVPKAERSRFGIVQLADEALYAAKDRGRNCLIVMDREYEVLSTGSFRKAAG